MWTGITPPARDGIPEVAPELARLTVTFARSDERLDRAADEAAAAPLDWLRHYRDLFWMVQGAFDAAGRPDEGPCHLVERGYYRIEVIAAAPHATALVARRAAAVAQALEELLLLEEEERPDLILPAADDDTIADPPAYRRVEVRLVRARVE